MAVEDWGMAVVSALVSVSSGFSGPSPMLTARGANGDRNALRCCCGCCCWKDRGMTNALQEDDKDASAEVAAATPSKEFIMEESIIKNFIFLGSVRLIYDLRCV